MENGKVKFYNREKKFGFIIGDDGKDYFFHDAGVSNEIYLRDGDKVEFKIIDGDRGKKAVDISPI
jgi:CspA family cold shock protein